MYSRKREAPTGLGLHPFGAGRDLSSVFSRNLLSRSMRIVRRAWRLLFFPFVILE
jgi:hypothetical protein